MNPIDLVKTQFTFMGLNDTQIKGALFFLAGIYSFSKNEASDQEKNRIYDYVEKSKFPEPYNDNDSEKKSSLHEISSSIFREILNIYDKENRFGIYQTLRGEDTTMIDFPDPLLFEVYNSQTSQLYRTHCFYIKICDEFGNLLSDRNEEESYIDGHLFWKETIPIWTQAAAPIMVALGDFAPTWFRFLQLIPNVNPEFITQTAPLQKYLQPLINDFFEPDLAGIEWAYSSWVCFKQGEILDDLNEMHTEDFFEYTQSIMSSFKEELTNKDDIIQILDNLPEEFSKKLFSNITSETELFPYTQNFIFEFFGIPADSIKSSSTIHEKLLWQSCMTHVNFCIGLKHDLLDS